MPCDKELVTQYLDAIQQLEDEDEQTGLEDEYSSDDDPDDDPQDDSGNYGGMYFYLFLT